MIAGVTNADALPVLERLLQFSGARHRLLVHNIANLDTPGFRPSDVSVSGFQEALGEAIDTRRERFKPLGAPLPAIDAPGVETRGDRLELHPEAQGANILFHDQNDRDLERTMQSLAENFMSFRLASDLLRNRFQLLETAIRERL